MSKNKGSVAKVISTIIIFSLMSKVLGFLRDYFTAVKFGTTAEADAFLMASNIPNTLFMLIGIAISTTFIPIYNDIKVSKSKEELQEFYNNITNILIFLSLVITILCEIFAPIIVSIMAPGFTGAKFVLTVKLTRILSSVIVLNTLIYLFISILQCEGNFNIPALIGIPYNIVLIFYYVFFADQYGVVGISIMVSIALMLQIIVLLKFLKQKKYKYFLKFNIKDKNLKKMMILIMPVAIGTGVQQLNGVFNGIYASSLGDGTVAAINYALKIYMLVIDIFILSIVTVYYQKISKAASEKNYDELKNNSNRSIMLIFIMLIPIVTLLLAYNEPIIKILFQRGKFNGEATGLTATALYYYCIGIFAVGVNYVLTRVCYSLNDTKTPLKNTIIAVLINISLGYILKSYMGIGGIALASTLGTIISAIILFINVNKIINGCINKKTIVSIMKLFISIAPMIILICISNKIVSISNLKGLYQIIMISIMSLLTIISYILIAIAMDVEEILEIKEVIMIKIKRKAA